MLLVPATLPESPTVSALLSRRSFHSLPPVPASAPRSRFLSLSPLLACWFCLLSSPPLLRSPAPATSFGQASHSPSSASLSAQLLPTEPCTPAASLLALSSTLFLLPPSLL